MDLKARYLNGQTWQEWIESAEKNKEKMLEKYENYAFIKLDGEFFRSIERKVHILVIAEDWCGDVVRQLPILVKMCEQSENLDLRIIDRDNNLDVMERYLFNGAQAIPVFVFFSDEFVEVGCWKVRPEPYQDVFARMKIDGNTKAARELTDQSMDAENDRLTVEELKNLIDLAQGWV